MFARAQQSRERVSLCYSIDFYASRRTSNECAALHLIPFQNRNLSLWLQWFKSIWLLFIFSNYYYDFYEADVPILWTEIKKHIFFLHLFESIRHRQCQHPILAHTHTHLDFHDQWLRLGCRSKAYLVVWARAFLRAFFVFADWIDMVSGLSLHSFWYFCEWNRIGFKQDKIFYMRSQVQWSTSTCKWFSLVRQDFDGMCVFTFDVDFEKNRNQQFD